MSEELLSQRLAGDPVLTRCLNGQHRMLKPETNDSVGVVQRLLIDMGYELPEFGADGSFGKETGTAVVEFKAFRGLKPTDPVIGPKTSAALDTVCLIAEFDTVPAHRPVENRDFIDAANIGRVEALKAAIYAIEDLKARFEPALPDESEAVVKAFERFLFTELNDEFWDVVNTALKLIAGNREVFPGIGIELALPDYVRISPSLNTADAMQFGSKFFADDAQCHREIVTHAYFHYIVGTDHFYDTTETDEAIVDPHHLTGLVFTLAGIKPQGCDYDMTCL